jgi:tetratricopeptide (TPR) repeat protein
MQEVKQAVDTQRQVLGLIQAAYDNLKASDAHTAAQLLEQALQLDFDNAELLHALRCVKWWLAHIERFGDCRSPYEKGYYILSQLKHYHAFLDRFDDDFERCQYAVRRYVFSSALRHFQPLLGDGVNSGDPGLLLQAGRCYKGVGNYDEALRFLEQAVNLKRDDGEALAELADLNALLAETRTAKTLFREAFFLSPGKIDMRSLESELILGLGDRVQGLGYGGPELCEWVPVFGNILGVFNVKRELKQVEVGRLKQSIFALEAEFQGGSGGASSVKPRLLNHYFWLIDHYQGINEAQELIDETLLKIKLTDPEIFRRYTGMRA